MSEKLTDYYQEIGLSVKYLHSDIDTLERVQLIKDLRTGACDVLIGINLLREGLDLPEVSLVAILDADKQGFLRSTRSLLQIAGRAARHLQGKVIMYADVLTESIKECIEITSRQRSKQILYNTKNKIEPQSIKKDITDWIPGGASKNSKKPQENIENNLNQESIQKKINLFEKQMLQAAEKLEFEKAAKLRDKVKELKHLYDILFSSR